MTWALVAGVAGALAYALWERGQRIKHEANSTKFMGEALDFKVRYANEIRDHKSDVLRLEALVAYLKSEIQSAIRGYPIDPGAVRSRLERVLAHAVLPDPNRTTPAPVPARPAASAIGGTVPLPDGLPE